MLCFHARLPSDLYFTVIYGCDLSQFCIREYVQPLFVRGLLCYSCGSLQYILISSRKLSGVKVRPVIVSKDVWEERKGMGLSLAGKCAPSHAVLLQHEQIFPQHLPHLSSFPVKQSSFGFINRHTKPFLSSLSLDCSVVQTPLQGLLLLFHSKFAACSNNI